jgi:histidinol-phosphate aminotransferase
VLGLSAYHVADASGLIKLDAMENPYNWPDELKAGWLQALESCELNRYPDPEGKALTSIIRSHYRIPQTFEILLGNGSDEIIQMLLMALPPHAAVMSVQPSFVMYQQISRSLGLSFINIPLLPDDFELDIPAMLAAIREHRPALIFLAYPNNPTGNCFDDQAIRQIVEASTGLVVIDEAYEPFANASFLDELTRYDNLLVMRTVSKLGLAGLRLGYLAGTPDVIEQINKIRLPYNINVLTQVSVAFALEHYHAFAQQTAQICYERAHIHGQLQEISGLKPYPSAANFILFKTPVNKASAIFDALKKQGVLIKNLNPQGGMLADCLRVTIGKPEENQAFLSALKNALKILQ